jgi:hypothetical protein
MSDQHNKPKTPMADMSESEIAMRKFLKALGVTTHQKLEAAMAEAVASGQMKSGESLAIEATIHILALDFSHDVAATLIAPDQD